MSFALTYEMTAEEYVRTHSTNEEDLDIAVRRVFRPYRKLIGPSTLISLPGRVV